MLYRELFEGRDAPLYHSTTSENAINILQNGKIKPTISLAPGIPMTNPSKSTVPIGIDNMDSKPSVSLTRDKNQFGSYGNVQFVISQVKLSQTHKIYPYVLGNDDEDDLITPSHKLRSEAEERVYKPIPISYIELIKIENYEVDANLLRLIKKMNFPMKLI